MSRIRIGVIGCASIARRSVIPAILSLPDHFELVCVASRDIEKATDFADQFSCKAILGYEELLNEDIDAVYIPLPTGLHDEWINKALLAGKHVYAEKSIADSFSGAKKMVDHAIANELALMEGYMFQYHSQHKLVKEFIDSGEIGEIRGFRSSFGFPPLSPDNFRYNSKIGGGALFDAAGYPLRATHFILGNDFEVMASSLYYNQESKTSIYGSAFLKGNKGLSAHISFGFDNFYQCNYELWGTKGKLIAERAFTPGPSFKPTITIEQQSGIKVITADADDHFVGAFMEFYNIIENPKGMQKHYDDILLQSSSLDKIKSLA